MNQVIYILIGISGSGKSTLALKMLAANPKLIRFNRDSYRLMLRNEAVCSPNVEAMITDMLYADATEALEAGMSIIIDNTHCSMKYINGIIKNLPAKYSNGDKGSLCLLHVDVDLETAVERDSKRSAPVGREIVERFYGSLETMFKNYKKELTELGLVKAEECVLCTPEQELIELKKQFQIKADEALELNSKIGNF